MTARAAAVALLLAAPLAAADKPNVLFVVADDLGWNDVGWHGGPPKTPHLDALVKAGVELDKHYVQPVCSPTRTALMTGRVPSRFGPQALVPSNLRCLPPGYPTLASALQMAGYETHMAGKWHLGSRPEWGPNQYGFAHGYGSLNGAVDPWKHLYRKGPYERTWHRDGAIFDEVGNATELVAAQVVKWIEAKKEPWFVYVPFHAVHIPVDAPPEYKSIYDGVTFDADPKKDESYRRFAAFVSQLDAKVGQFVAALDRTGQRGNTLVVFTSDNGGLWQGGNAYTSDVPPTPRLSSNLPLRGQKGQLYEGGVRVPAFANWPGRLAPRKVGVPLHAVDWYPTLMAATGATPVGDPKWDGLDRWPVLTGAVSDPGPRTVYIPYTGGAAVRHGDWKLIDRANGTAELFDLAADPNETTDLAAKEPGRLAELRKVLAALRAGDQTKLPADLVGVPN
jgi:arylsulfatase A-like enzyme